MDLLTQVFCNMYLGPISFPDQLNWPPSIMMWINAYIGGGGCVLFLLWPYIIVPLDIILGFTLLHAAISAWQSIFRVETGGFKL